MVKEEEKSDLENEIDSTMTHVSAEIKRQKVDSEEDAKNEVTHSLDDDNFKSKKVDDKSNVKCDDKLKLNIFLSQDRRRLRKSHPFCNL